MPSQGEWQDSVGSPVVLVPVGFLTPAVAIASLAFLGLLGGLAARAGGASAVVGAARVTLRGALAMAVTYGAGALFGAVV